MFQQDDQGKERGIIFFTALQIVDFFFFCNSLDKYLAIEKKKLVL